MQDGKERKDDIEEDKADERMDDAKAAEGEGEEAGREAIIGAQHDFGICCYGVPVNGLSSNAWTCCWSEAFVVSAGACS